ncbi:SdrD B-like domain-containing protein [Staphylococcus intermedius]|uniref:SdrD B-like domain-containing protein n=1 Tax=Staphylococcus intermedius TaxID=1285 RepID=UPI000BBCBE88|nr:SdrD B-like domain-containing protein [Staphylococcus intermedius]PCF89586.1 hypothetical protein B4W75_01740 [Staphylococcus intermedius]
MNKKTNAFLPNKQNKYSIRKYTVGTASLLIGATLLFGSHTEDANAAEETTVDNSQVNKDEQPDTTVEENKAEATPTTEETSKTEVTTAENASTVKEAEVTPSTEEKVATSSEVAPPTEENAEVKSSVENKADVTPATKQNEVDTTSNVKTEAVNPPVAKTVESEEVVAPKEAATSSEVAPEVAQAPSNEQIDEGTFIGVPITENNFNILDTDEEKSEALVDFYAKNTGLSIEAATEKVQSMNIDYSKVNAQDVLAQLLVEYANEQDKKKVVATPVSLRSPRAFMRLAVAAQPSGQLITKDNGISNIKTTMVDVDKDNANGDGTIYPQNFGYVKIQTSFDVADSVKSGDTFQIKYNDNLQISDYFEDRVTPPSIYNAGGDLIATGTYDIHTRTMTYTFTDYVDQHNDVKVALDLAAYVERDVVKDNGTYNFDATVAGQTTSTQLNVKYLDPRENKQLNLNSFYNEYDNVTGKYSQTAYINPKQQQLINPKIVVKGYSGADNATPGSSSAVVSPAGILQVYEVPDGVALPGNLKPDFTQLKMLTVDQDYTLSYGDDMATIVLNDKNSTKRYVVYTEGQQDMNSNAPLVQSVTLHGETSDANGEYFSHLYSENFIETTQSDAAGQGEPTYKLGNRVWEDMNNNDVQDINDRGIANVTVTLKEAGTNKVLQTTTTDKDGYYLFENLKNGDYIVEFTDPTKSVEGKDYVPVNERVGNDKEVDSDAQIVNVTIQGKDDLSIDRGFEVAPEPKFNLGDKVWEDTNKDGIQDANEPGIENVKVTLTKEDGTTVTTTTDKDGNYKFTDLPNGNYTVTFETPNGYEATTPNAGSDDAKDSDGQTVKVIIDNKDDMTIDSGFHKPTPDEPGNPSNPTPDEPGNPSNPTPDEPGNPSNPTPDEPGNPSNPTPDEPSNPSNPTPDEPSNPSNPTPDEPGNPSNPTPDEPGNPSNPTPEQPGNPSNPTPEMPEQPGQPGQPSPSMHTTPMSTGSHMNSSHNPAPKQEMKSLPETGETPANQAPLLGGLLAALGGLFFVGRRKKQKEQ